MDSSPRPQQLYIVDDSPAIRERLFELLARVAGVNVVGHAETAPQAVRDILALRPDTVLLDLELKDSNGLQVLRAIHPCLPDVAFVVLSNHTEPQYRSACARAGATCFLDKASEFAQVAAVVAGLARRH